MTKGLLCARLAMTALVLAAMTGLAQAADPPKSAAAPAKTAPSGDPTKICPDVYKTLMENERVRVCDVHFNPGQKAAMHSHPAHVVYVMNDCKLSIHTSDGKTNVVELKAGAALMMPAGSHEVTNLGTTEAHNLVVELKR